MSRGNRACRRRRHEDATRKLLPCNLSYTSFTYLIAAYLSGVDDEHAITGENGADGMSDDYERSVAERLQDRVVDT